MVLLFVSWPLEKWNHRRHSPTDGGNRSGGVGWEFTGQVGGGALGVVVVTGVRDVSELMEPSRIA
jgi:hypothetical protein